MTRIDNVRAATSTAKDSVLHAAEAVAPYAGTARDQAQHYAHEAAHYAQEARVRLQPRVSAAANQARGQYEAHLAPRIEKAAGQARAHVPPRVENAARDASVQAQRAAKQARKAAHQAVETARPRVEQAAKAAGPARDEAVARSTAALAALRGQVSAKEVAKLVQKHERQARRKRLTRGLAIAGVLAGGAYAAWKWWDRQANPDWLVEPPAPTEVAESATTLTAVDATGRPDLDPEVQAKQAEADSDGEPR